MAKRVIAGGLAVLAIVLVYVVFGGLPRWTAPMTAKPAAPAARTVAVPLPPGRKIKARLFYVAEDGMRLTSVERDVQYGEGAAEQAREIVAAQIAPVVGPLVSAVPPGTALRAVFITDS